MMEGLAHLFSLVCGHCPGHVWAPGGLELPLCQRCAGLYAGACCAVLLMAWFRPPAGAGFLWAHGAFLLQMVPLGYHWIASGPEVRTLSGALFAAGLVAFLQMLPSARWSDWRRGFRPDAGTDPRDAGATRPNPFPFGWVNAVSSCRPCSVAVEPWTPSPHPLPRERGRGIILRTPYPGRRALRALALGWCLAPFQGAQMAGYWVGLLGSVGLILSLAKWGGPAGAVVLTGMSVAGLIALGGLAALNLVLLAGTLVSRPQAGWAAR